MNARRLSRRGLLAAGAVLPLIGRRAFAAREDAIYDLPRFGNARILYMTDTHAQLNPVYFREPSVNIGIGTMRGQPPRRIFRPSAGLSPNSS